MMLLNLHSINPSINIFRGP